ncbi:hypothetical protein YC2023_052382 [Brassica napus]
MIQLLYDIVYVVDSLVTALHYLNATHHHTGSLRLVMPSCSSGPSLSFNHVLIKLIGSYDSKIASYGGHLFRSRCADLDEEFPFLLRSRIDLCDSCCCFAAPSSVISLPAEDYKLAGGSSRDWILCEGAGVAVCLCTVLSFGASVFYVLLCLLVEGWCGAVLVIGKVIVSGFLRRVGFSDTSGARLEIEDLLTVQCSRWERCRCFR